MILKNQSSKQLFVLLFLCFSVVCFAGEWPRQMHIYKGTTPKVDGKIDKGEYDDATTFAGVSDWLAQFSPTTDAKDCSLKGWAKHDGENIYFAFEITDDVIYGIETDRWLPAENEKVHELSRKGFPWFGDGMELLLNPGYTWDHTSDCVNGTAKQWQMVCNTTKSWKGGIGKGGILQGEPRREKSAWDNYTKWIEDGAIEAVVQIHDDKNGYTIEWKLTPAVLENTEGKPWSPKMGVVKMGLNIGIQDFDEKEKGEGNFGNMHHEDWWTGNKDTRTGAREFGTLVVHPEKKRLRREDCFFGLHFDFHAGPDCIEIGKTVTREMIANMLDRVKPDFVQVDTKGHGGYASYPTKVGYPAPGFVKDQLKIWREVTAEKGVSLYSHFSGVWDSQAVKHHPGWARVDAEGNVDTNITSVFGPYVDKLMIPQIQELRSEYGIDGVWIDGDCWAVRNDYSEHAMNSDLYKKFLAEGKTLPRKAGEENYYEFLQMNREGFRRYLHRYVDELHKFDSGFQVCSNWACSSLMPEPATFNLDFLSGDTSAVDGVHDGRMEGRFMRCHGRPWDLMPWSFYYDFSPKGCFNLRPPVQLRQEAASVISLGGGFQAYFRQHRDGSIIDWQVDLMADVAKFCRERQAYCEDAKPVPQVALISSTDAIYRWDRQKNPFGHWGEKDTNLNYLHKLRGALNLLLDRQESVEIHMEGTITGRMKDYPLIVIPEWNYLAPEFIEELVQYVKGGGNLLLIGPDPIVLFKDHLALSSDYVVQEGKRSIEHDGILAGNHTRFIVTQPQEGVEVLGHFYTDPQYESTNIPSATLHKVGKGQIACIHFDLGWNYLWRRNSYTRDFVGSIVDKLFPQPIVTVTGSHYVDVVLNEKDGDWMVNLVNNSGPHEFRRVEIFDEILPVGPLKVVVRMNKKPKKVLLQPGDREVDHQWCDGMLKIDVPRVELLDIIQIKR